ncbi:hypothetical protein ABZ208_37840 [Streptomyces sp. NPDC006208]|uniref:hypothetical protein n=1 Tax=Streptomyces sp. NPDC006208 TaxID=3156734 RepID=UPI00339DF87E
MGQPVHPRHPEDLPPGTSCTLVQFTVLLPWAGAVLLVTGAVTVLWLRPWPAEFR